MSVKTRYTLLQCLYWMSACVGWGYGISYLVEYGYSTAALGILFAVFSLVAAILQPVLGRLADRSRVFYWKRILLILVVMQELMLAGIFFTEQPVLAGLFYGAYSMLVSTTISMVNVACFYYEHRGEKMNFGVARGLGSLSYAVLSVSLGRLIAPLGIRVVIVAGLILTAAMLVVTLILPYDGAVQKEETAAVPRKSIPELLRKYPAFFLMVLACTLFLTFHNMCSNYLLLILEAVGGDNASLGAALALAAVVEIPMMFVSGKLVKRFPSAYLLTFAGIMLVVRGLLYAAAGSVLAVYLIQFLQIVTFAMIASITVYFTDECIEEEDLATGQSFMGMTVAAGSTFGFFLGGLIIDKAGITSMLLIGTAITAVGVVIAMISCNRRTQK